jgi:hypothetical protein
MSINVVWHAQKDGRGRYNCTAQINDLFDQYNCVHHAGWDGIPEDIEDAVVVVHGGRERGRLDKLNMDIEDLKSVLLIFLGDEEADFPAEFVEHSNKICWVQEPLPGRHDFADRYILDGYTPHTRKNIVKCEKDLDFVFAGQMTHERRWACRNALQTIDWGGVIVESKGYCQGVSIEEYYRLLCRAKIVPCPSGPMSPDSARVCESLECGCVPILDDLSPTRKEPGFWSMVLGPDHPFFVVTDWGVLPSVIREVKADWDRQILRCLAWWEAYKLDFSMWLGADIEKLTGRECTKIR